MQHHAYANVACYVANDDDNDGDDYDDDDDDCPKNA